MTATGQRRGARERILAAADELFYRDGIADTGVDAVVQAADVALGTVYKHFSGKAGLVEEYLRRRDHQWRSTWEAAIAAAGSPAGRVLAVFDAIGEWARERGLAHGCAQIAALNQLPDDHPGARIARRHKRHLRDRLAELAQEEGYRDPARLALSVSLLYEGALATYITEQRPSVIAHARRVAEFALGDHQPDQRQN